VILPSLAYIGPGAGFAFLGSFLLLLGAMGLVVLSVLSWPFRAAVRLVRHPRTRPRPGVRRVIVVGLDGLDPVLYRRAAARGKVPNLERLARDGAFRELLSTCPPISPVAWSSFMTGANPGKHAIFDFLSRDPRTCALEPSSARIETRRARGRARPAVTGLRRSTPFWHLLGERGIFSTVLRVPITFPPERFEGLLLSGMCVPDLRGTQGSYTLFTTRAGATAQGGLAVPLREGPEGFSAELPGPPAGAGGDGSLRAPVRVRIASADCVEVRLAGGRHVLKAGAYSPWIRVPFGAGPLRRVTGICRLLLLRTSPHLEIYATPLHIDPARPALPVSHPPFYAVHLAKLIGPFATLGLAEDTNALNDGVLDEPSFLRQVYDIHEERERMFLAALDRTRRGFCMAVFDAPDRVQHMFPGPLAEGLPGAPPSPPSHEQALDGLYARMDELVGRVASRLGRGDVLFVISDHGFTAFHRAVHLNAWLRREGYLVLSGGAAEGSSLADMDWARTRAYAFGLSGIHLNRRGREARGIVAPEEAAGLKASIAAGLKQLRDGDAAPVREVYDTAAAYSGPYAADAPDLVVGYERGYRASWETALGRTPAEVVVANPKHWSGDHCVDVRAVPGVLFCSAPCDFASDPALTDLAPTVLDLFGIAPPAHMDGRAFSVRVRTGR
jgi:predicted AlkP superfamily phosphohydrolase/phosphomutase